MQIAHPRRSDILRELKKRSDAAGIFAYRIELLSHDQLGWDARFDVAGGNAPYELKFLQIVSAIREEFGP